MKKYRTSEVAEMMRIHPNTVRFYEEWGLITKPVREANGYRVFHDLHIYQIQVARDRLLLSLAKAEINAGKIMTILKQIKEL